MGTHGHVPAAADERVARTAHALHGAHAVAERLAAGTLVHDGWDGASVAHYVLHLPCGCHFTRDGRVLLRVTPGCLAAAVVDAQ